MGLYRLCLGKTADGKTGYTLLLPTLASLLSFLEDALSIKPVKNLEVSTFLLYVVRGHCKHWFFYVIFFCLCSTLIMIRL